MYSPIRQRTPLPSVGGQRDISTAHGRSFLRANSRPISHARKGVARASGISSTPPGGSGTLGSSMTIKSHQRMTLNRWPGSRQLHLAMRPRSHLSNEHLPRYDAALIPPKSILIKLRFNLSAYPSGSQIAPQQQATNHVATHSGGFHFFNDFIKSAILVPANAPSFNNSC